MMHLLLISDRWNISQFLRCASISWFQIVSKSVSHIFSDFQLIQSLQSVRSVQSEISHNFKVRDILHSLNNSEEFYNIEPILHLYLAHNLLFFFLLIFFFKCSTSNSTHLNWRKDRKYVVNAFKPRRPPQHTFLFQLFCDFFVLLFTPALWHTLCYFSFSSIHSLWTICSVFVHFFVDL